MDKRIVAVMGVLLVAGLITPAMAQELGRIGRPLPRVRVLHMLGTGIAVSTEDPMDFKVIRVGVATVRVLGEELKVGVMFLDGERYKIKDIEVGNGTASGNVYSNDTQVGSFDVTLTIKGKHHVWVGTLEVNGESYNVYVLEVSRPVKPLEAAEKIENLCERFPVKCTRIAKGIAKERVKDFCEEHPGDERCIALFREFCKNNPHDVRCRYALKKYCENKPTSEECLRFEYKVIKRFCKGNPNNPKCVAVRERLSKLPRVIARMRRGESFERAVEETETEEVEETP
jgi:hypothetical protein